MALIEILAINKIKIYLYKIRVKDTFTCKNMHNNRMEINYLKINHKASISNYCEILLLFEHGPTLYIKQCYLFVFIKTNCNEMIKDG